MRFTIIDTSVLCEFLAVPGVCKQPEAVQAEFKSRATAGERFVVPITAVIETGNHIAQIKSGDRWGAATRFANLLGAAMREESPFVLHRVAWDDEFLSELCGGNATGQTLGQLAGTGTLGAGDVAILVERDRLLASTAYAEAFLWTLDGRLQAFNL